MPQGVIASPVLQPRIDRHALEPGPESVGVVQLPDGAPRLHKYLLRQVVRERFVAATPAQQVTNPGLSTADNLRESVTVSGAGEPDEYRLRTFRK